jgi:peptide/nickel transport system substrate-binding protein
MIPAHRGRRLVASAATGAALVLLAAACGSASSAPGTSNAPTAAAPPSRTFSSFDIAMDEGIDALDPGLSNTTEGWGVMWNVYLPLIGYRHADGAAGATLVPYLAEKLPRVSRDGKTYTLVLRPGLKYSNGSPVRASDFRYAIERDFQLDSVGVGFFDDIVGAKDYGETKKGHIAGIHVNDFTRQIVIHLVQPEGDFENILATLYAAPVPSNTPIKDASITPIPSTGPYVIKSYEPNKQILEVRNPHFHASLFDGNVPAGNPDTVRWDLIGSDSVALQRVISGKDDWMSYHAIPANKLGLVRRRYGDQLRIFTPANVYYFFMNTKVAPFDNVKVRRAVNYAIDRSALVAILGGLARPTENILPPTYPQYRPHTLYPFDLAKAKKLVRESGDRGMEVTVWNHDLGADPKFTDYLANVLRELGFQVSTRIVNSNAYWTTVGNRATQAQIGFANWFQDYPHPLDWFSNLLSGERITKTFNNNYSNFDNPAVDKEIDALGRKPTLTRAIDRRWAALDKRVMEAAPWAPFLNREQTDFFSARVDLDCYENNVVYEFDYATICVKPKS